MGDIVQISTPPRDMQSPVYKVLETVKKSVSDLKEIDQTALAIRSQGKVKSFLNKGENIEELASQISKLTTIQQRSFDSIVLLIGAAGKIKGDYNILISSLDEMLKLQSNNTVVLEYLLKIKGVVEELKTKDQAFELLETRVINLRQDLIKQEEIINSFEARIQALLKKDNLKTYILFAVTFTIALSSLLIALF